MVGKCGDDRQMGHITLFLGVTFSQWEKTKTKVDINLPSASWYLSLSWTKLSVDERWDV